MEEPLHHPYSPSAHSVLDVFKQHLKDCYSCDSQSPSCDDCEWPHRDNAKFVQPRLTLKPTNDQRRGQEKKVALTDIISACKHGNKPAKILLEGVAGSGKTTISWHACQEWAKGNMFQEFELLIHLSLADPDIQSATSFENIIPHPSEKVRKDVAEAIIEQRGEKVLFVMDGWEDLPTTGQTSTFLRSIIRGDPKVLLSRCAFIVTSRPFASSSIVKCMSSTLSMEEFSDNDVASYTTQYFSTQEESERFLSSLRARQSVYSLCSLPINLVTIIFLYQHCCHTFPSTQTELYESLVLVLLLRHLRTKLGQSLENLSSFSKLPTPLKPVFDALCKVAHFASFKYPSQSQVNFTHAQLQDANIPIPEDTLGLMKVSGQLTCRGCIRQYSFLHSAVQDFLCAVWMSRLEEDEQEDNVHFLLRKDPKSPVLQFFAGYTHLKRKHRERLRLIQCVEKEGLLDVLQHMLPESHADEMQIVTEMSRTDDNVRHQLQLRTEAYKEELEMVKKISRGLEYELEQMRSTVIAREETIKKSDIKVMELETLVQDLRTTSPEIDAHIAKYVTKDAATQANYLSLTGALVHGVEECGETVLEITGSKHQKVFWKDYGFHLTVPDGAVSNDVTVSVAVKAILAGQFQLPDDTHLVSAIYWVSASEMFHREVSVCIQHCAIINSEEESSKYKFIVGKYSQESLPYTFEIMDGVFSPKSRLATISVKKFSFFGVIFQGFWESNRCQYTSHCYFKRDPEWTSSCNVHFLVTRNLSPCLQVIKKNYEEWTFHHMAEVEFEEKSPAGEGERSPASKSITLEITAPEEGESKNWDIFQVIPMQIFKQSVDESPKDVSTDIPYCKLVIEWKGPETAKVPFFRRRINLVGAKAPNNFFNFHFRPSRSVAASATSAAGSVTRSPAALSIEHLGIIKQELPNFVAWRRLGLSLGLNPGRLDVIEKDYGGVDECLYQVLTHWLRRNDNTDKDGSPSWDRLVNALHPIDCALADSIRENHC